MSKISKSSQQQEAWVAALLKGRKTARSGALEGDADVLIKHWMCECKETTVKASITLQLKDWERVRYDAAHQQKDPMMHLRMKGLSLFVVDCNDAISIFENAGAHITDYTTVIKPIARMASIVVSLIEWDNLSWALDRANFILVLSGEQSSVSAPKPYNLALIEESAFTPIFCKAMEKVVSRNV